MPNHLLLVMDTSLTHAVYPGAPAINHPAAERGDLRCIGSWAPGSGQWIGNAT
jgi:hypothetical protein